MTVKQPHIGTLAEKSLHSALKQWYARPGDRLETAVDGYVVDIVRDTVLIEIQTRNFSAVKRKLKALIDTHPIRLVHPISCEKWIVRLEHDEQTLVSRRKSPRRGSVYHVFSELVRIPGLIKHPHFSLEVLLIQEEEFLVNDGGGSWRRKGWSVYDRKLLTVVENHVFEVPQDFSRLLPGDLPQPFTTHDLGAQLRMPLRIMQKMTYCLRHMGVIEPAGKRGNSILYRHET